MKRRTFLKTSAAALCGPIIQTSHSKQRPNILFAMSDDQSWPHAGAYGSRMVNTPAFDWVAREGCLFSNAFASAPQCSPNRASILTGRPIWSLDEAGTHSSYFPKKWTVYPDLLEQAGYCIGYTGKAWGPGNWQDAGRPRNPGGEQFSQLRINDAPQGINKLDYAANFEAFLKEKPDNAPFYFWYGCYEPHRVYQQGVGQESGKQLSDASVPPFLPDNGVIRGDLLDYAHEIEWFDAHLMRMLNLLKERGELDNTIVIVTSDNGMPFPGAKATLYEYGIHMPLAIRWPDGMKGGRTIDDFVPFIDYAPTILEAAGVKIPNGVMGRSFLDVLTSNRSGQVDPDRTRIVAGRERHSHSRFDNWAYPARCIRTDKWLYIRNFKSDRVLAGDPPGYHDIDDSPSKSYLIEHREEEHIQPLFEHSYGKNPPEQLFDIRRDPGCLNNLADQPQLAATKNQLWSELLQQLEKGNDPRVKGKGDAYESYPRFGGMRPQLGGFAERGKYNPSYQ
ncbi:MAG: sulfatase [Candidatus Hinthialibacter antarcticus]|nr:sulfatase [Candidatus Hinthialibacter antarcticus]